MKALHHSRPGLRAGKPGRFFPRPRMTGKRIFNRPIRCYTINPTLRAESACKKGDCPRLRAGATNVSVAARSFSFHDIFMNR